MSWLLGMGLAGALLVALVQTIRAERANVSAADLDARLKLAQSAVKGTQTELSLTRVELADQVTRARAVEAQFEGRIRVYQSLLAQRPEIAGDRLRDLGKRVSGPQGGGNPGPTTGVPGKPTT